jgi:GNAT superfamily N-acetyltransferase
MSSEVTIRRFQERDSAPIRDLFIAVNRQLVPPHMRDAFEAYITRSLTEEMDRVSAYYGERGGGFWVAEHGAEIVGMFGLERAGPGACELRRMYVAPTVRRRGVASLMLRFAEHECRRLSMHKIELSTSELQPSAVELYRKAGYQLVCEAIVADASNKTVGGGIRRFYFEKTL